MSVFVNTAAVRPSAANLASLPLQQYHQKIFHPHNGFCVDSDNRLHCNISRVTAPGLRLYPLDFTLALHSEAISGTNATLNTDKNVVVFLAKPYGVEAKTQIS